LAESDRPKTRKHDPKTPQHEPPNRLEIIFFLREQRIEAAEGGEGGEVAVGSPEFADTVVEAKGGDAGVVNFGTANFSGEGELAQFFEISRSLTQEAERGACLPSRERIQGNREGSGRLVDFRMSRDGQELMKTGPGDGPWFFGIGQSGDFLVRAFMPRGVFAVGVDQDVGVDRDHE